MVGGDCDKLFGVEDIDCGVVVGVVVGVGVGVVVGLVIVFVMGLFGVVLGGLVGGYFGGLVGSLVVIDEVMLLWCLVGMLVVVVVEDEF